MQIKYRLNGKEINLTSENTTIKSMNFSVDKNGNMMAKGGTIGGFSLGTNKFSTTINGIYDFNYYDAQIALLTFVHETIDIPSLYNLYDIDGNGEVDSFDAQDMLFIKLGQQANNKRTTGTFEINTASPKDFISVKHGSDLAVSIGVGGINTYLLGAENIVVSMADKQLQGNTVTITGKDGSIYASGTISGKEITNISMESIKKNISKFNNALDIIKNSEIYEYNFKTEGDTDKKHVGFVIGEKYNTPNIVKSSDGKAIESYTMSAINWRGLQQAIEIIENLNKRLLVLERK